MREKGERENERERRAGKRERRREEDEMVKGYMYLEERGFIRYLEKEANGKTFSVVN